MKRIKYVLLALLLLSMGSMQGFAQHNGNMNIIVLPDNVWMETNGYMEQKEADGMTAKIPKYQEALTMNRDMSYALTCVEKMLTDRGFSSIGHSLVAASLKEGKDMREIELEEGAGLRITVDYTVNKIGPRSQIVWTVKTTDRYNHQTVAAINETMDPTSDPFSLAFRKAVASKGDEFFQQLLSYFTSIRENGREIRVKFRSDYDKKVDFLQEKAPGSELTIAARLKQIMENYVIDRNLKPGRQTRSVCEFIHMRVPSFTSGGNMQSPEEWMEQVAKKIASELGMDVTVDKPFTIGDLSFTVSR